MKEGTASYYSRLFDVSEERVLRVGVKRLNMCGSDVARRIILGVKPAHKFTENKSRQETNAILSGAHHRSK